VSVALAREGDDVLFITQTGMLVRTPVSEISTIGRNTQGVRLVNLKDGDKLVSLEVVSEADLDKYATEARERPVTVTPIVADDATSDADDDEEVDDTREEE
jgi:DNA gyrase subunit A